MKRNRVRPFWVAGAAATAMFSHAALSQAAVYTDTVGDNNGGSVNVDISGASVTNDGSNITFTIDLNPSADLTSTDASYVHYELALQTGPGGYTTLSNPYSEQIGVSTGWNYYALGYVYTNNGTAGTPGADLYSGNSSGYTKITSAFTVTDVTTGTPSFTISIPLATLGLSAGSSFNFDAYTTYSGGSQGAYDALDNPTPTPGTPYTPVTPYDSATASGSQFGTAAYSYTVSAVPEPASLGLLGFAGVMAMRRLRK